jgi:hypothetical protein
MKSKINLIILSIIVVICSGFLIHETFAQNIATEATNSSTPETTDPPIADPTTAAVSAIGLAGAGTALITSIVNDRKQKKNVKGTDVDFAKALIILSKIFQVLYELDPKWKEALDTRANSNKLDKTTLGEAFTTEVDGWAAFIQETYNVARPSMSIPTIQGNNSDTTQKPTETKTKDEVSK